jgi:hypothetical protein
MAGFTWPYTTKPYRPRPLKRQASALFQLG